MKITYKQQAFDRINAIPNPDRYKDPIVSEVLLLKEQLRLLYWINLKMDSGLIDFQLSINPLNLIFSDKLDSPNLDGIIESNWTNKNYNGFGFFGYVFVKLFLIWDVLSEDEKVSVLNISNPYDYSIRILERRFAIDKERHPIMYRINMGPTLSANLQKYNQTIPFITSTDNEYLDALDAYYLQYKMLPPWLDADNQRGFVK